MPALGKALTVMLIVLLITSIVGLTVFALKVTSKIIVVPDDYPTIQEAVGNATAGDTVYVRNGVYKMPFGGLTISKPLTLIGQSNKNTIINSYPYVGSFNNYLITISSSNVALSGFNLEPAEGIIGIWIINESEMSNIKIIGNNIEGGIVAHGDIEAPGISQNLIVSQNYFAGEGISSEFSNSIISHNYFNESGGAGVAIGIGLSGCRNVTISGNEFVNSSSSVYRWDGLVPFTFITTIYPVVLLEYNFM